MRPGLLRLTFAFASCIVAASPAQAVICYVVYDRNENVIYQDSYPPVDMSNAGAAQRDALRARGEHLTFGDINACPRVVFLTGSGGTTDLRVDEVVTGLPVRTISGNPAAAAAASRGIPAGVTPTGFRAPSGTKPGTSGY